MAHPNERHELLAAWRALSSTRQAAEGWNAIPFAKNDSIRAGRHFPGNEEAVLIGFNNITVPTADHLPQGRGFFVAGVDIHDQSHQHWVALSRRSDGSLDLFTTMVLDIIETVRSTSARSTQQSFHLFLTRIRAWQDFMRRGADSTLGPQAEIGLVGELATLIDIINVGVHPSIPIDAWEGPTGGIHDFALGTGAIEVKTTIATTGFPAVIDSLDQLDNASRQPLFLAGIRLRPDPKGASLPDLVDRARALIGDDPATDIFDAKLLHAGYMHAARDHYQRRYETVETRIITVDNSFPRLTKASVPSGILGARYEIDLDQAQSQPVKTHEALEQLGVL
jgi:hypothetical protein